MKLFQIVVMSVVFAAAALLSACGQRGPLVLPHPPESLPKPTPSSAKPVTPSPQTN